ncbi:hypothetical protein CBER1_11442 [Cercospora berteroae]|uniref:DASH complex subunit ASK1 n=1 Tax=Cercospora berteroae TaxID=357750 RepID=A0A2S6BZD5_9PEZI|nr:hypothetical protein CBER1_11442 [Cercospora berteroae]
MSRPILTQPPRGLTLTEELEKLEQQITLTLQEIDSNFSKAHRIVTSSILPIVEDYAKHSNDVWEGSKFWKQFFEASANVSLSGYEENANEDNTQTDATQSFQTSTDHDESTITGASAQEDEEEFSTESPTQMTGLQTTPKLPASTTKSGGKTRQGSRPVSSYRSPSPRKYTGRNPRGGNTPGTDQPSTPRMSIASDMDSSPFQPQSAFEPPSAFQTQQENHDPLMHRVLDKNYRIQATPMTQRRQHQAQAASKPAPAPATATKKQLWDDSPQSSPETSAPQLRSELFSPAKPAPRIPGVSVLTPATRKTGPPPPMTSTGKQLFSAQDKAYAASKDRTRASHIFEDSDEDEDFFADISPPKTMQFHVPQSRLVQTPAREASKKIVDDLLLTAGADATDDIEDDSLEFEVPSPSVVRQGWQMDEDTF